MKQKTFPDVKNELYEKPRVQPYSFENKPL